MWSACMIIALAIGAPPTDAELQARAKELVAKLGDPAFRVREKATAELLELGYAAKDAVVAGQKSSDIEISERCKKIYPIIWQRDLEKRLAKFLATKDGGDPDGLPAAKRWFELVGDSQATREMYTQLVKQHVETLVKVELQPDQVKTQYAEFVKNNYTRTIMPGGGVAARGQPTITDLHLFFFLGAMTDVRPTTPLPGTSSVHYSTFLNSIVMNEKLPTDEPLRKLFAAWLVNERYSITQRAGLTLVGTHKVREAVPMLVKVANDPAAVVTTRSAALMAFAKMGTKDDMKELEQFDNNKTVLATVSFSVNGKIQQATVQMRDLALGAKMQILGQNPLDFGFERKPPAGLVTTSYTYYAFSNDENREATHKKWSEWAKANLKK